MTNSVNINLPLAWSKKVFDENINKLTSVFGKTSPSIQLLADAAFQALMHAHDHGDPIYCKRLYDAVDGGKGAIRGESMKVWFGQMGPIIAKLNKDKERVWAMKAGWKQADFKLEQALEKPFWEFIGEEKVRFYSAENILQQLKGFGKRVDSAAENGRYKGDAMKTKEALATIYSFAEAQMNRLTPAERGVDLGVTEQVILAAALIPNTEATLEVATA